MSTTNLASSASRSFIVRPLDGQNQVYDNITINATVRNLKERIFVAENIPVEDQKLIYGAEILDDSRTLESYHIPEDFVTRLLRVVGQAHTPSNVKTSDDTRVLENVFIKSANGATVTMAQIKLLTTVQDFRKQYCLKRNQDPDFCRMIYSGKQLEDSKPGKVMTLMDYDVQNGSTLHEVYRLPGGNGVDLPFGFELVLVTSFL